MNKDTLRKVEACFDHINRRIDIQNDLIFFLLKSIKFNEEQTNELQGILDRISLDNSALDMLNRML